MAYQYPGGLATGGEGHESGGTWGWLTGSKDKTYTVDPANFDPRPIGDQWQSRVGQSLTGNQNVNGANVDAARGMTQGREGLLGALQQMHGRPLDSTALGKTMMQQGQQQVAGNMAAQAASAPGRYNPATMRTAQMGMAGAGQQMALGAQQQAMAAAMQERAARDAAITSGYGALDQNDIRRLMAEQEQRMNDQKFWGAQQAAGQGWSSLGLQDKQLDAASRRAYEQLKMAGHFGKDVPGDPTGGQIVGAGMSALGTYLAGGSDRNLKENIRPARQQAAAMLDALAKNAKGF